MELERRADPRIRQDIEISVYPPDGGPPKLKAITVNKSALGIGFVCRRSFSPGQEISILYIPEDSFAPVKRSAIVRHSRPVGNLFHVGVELY